MLAPTFRRALAGAGALIFLAGAGCRDNRVIVRDFEEAYCAADAEPLLEIGTVDAHGTFAPLQGSPRVLPVFAGWLAMSAPLALRMRGIAPEDAVASVGWDLESQTIDEDEFGVDLVCDGEGNPEPVVYTISIGDQYGAAEDYVEPVAGRLRIRVAASGTVPSSCTEDSDVCLVADEDVVYVLGE